MRIKEPVKVRTKVLKDKTQSIYLDIYYQGKRSKEYLKLYLTPSGKTAQDKTNMLIANSKKGQRIKEILEGKFGIEDKRGTNITLMEWIEEVTKRREQSGQSKERMCTYLSLQEHLKMFLRGRKVLLVEVNKKFLIDFIHYLTTKATNRRTKGAKKLIGTTTAMQYFLAIVAALNEAERDELIVTSPHHKLSPLDKKPLSSPKTHKNALTKEEVEILEGSECKQAEVKNAFLFSCYCGLRLSDITTLKWGEIIQDGKGNTYLQKVQQKTQNEVSAALTDKAIQFLPKTRGEDNELVFQLPITKQYISIVVKRWCERVLGKKVTFHIARHSFGTFYYSATHDPYGTAKAMGHKDIKSTLIYAEWNKDTSIEQAAKMDALFSKEEGQK